MMPIGNLCRLSRSVAHSSIELTSVNGFALIFSFFLAGLLNLIRERLDIWHRKPLMSIGGVITLSCLVLMEKADHAGRSKLTQECFNTE